MNFMNFMNLKSEIDVFWVRGIVAVLLFLGVMAAAFAQGNKPLGDLTADEKRKALAGAEAGRPADRDLHATILDYEIQLEQCVGRCVDIIDTLGMLYYQRECDEYAGALEAYSSQKKAYDSAPPKPPAKSAVKPPAQPPAPPPVPGFSRSLGMYQRLERDFPGYSRMPEMRARMADVYRAVGNSDTARVILEEVIKRFPKSPNLSGVHYSLADLLIAAGDYTKAYGHLKQIKSYQIDTVSWEMAQYRMGECVYNMGDLGKAVDYFFTYIEDCDAGHNSGQLRNRAIEYMATAFFGMGDPLKEVAGFFKKRPGRRYEAQVVQHLNNLLAPPPPPPPPRDLSKEVAEDLSRLFLKGTNGLLTLVAAYEDIGAYEKAAVAIEKLMSGPPPLKDPKLAFKRASLVERKAPDSAIGLFEENIAAYPGDHRNFLRAGVYYSRKSGRRAEARAMLERCVAISDTAAGAWYELGFIYGAQKSDSSMMAAFRKFTAIESKNADAILKIGEYLLVDRKMPANAMEFIEMANGLKPNDPKVMSMLAIGCISVGRAEEGMGLLERIVGDTVGGAVDVEVRAALADVYLALGRNAEAAAEWGIVIRSKREPRYLIKYAAALAGAARDSSELAGASRDSAALAIVAEVLAKQPENIEALMLSGRMRAAMGDHAGAMEAFTAASYIDHNYAPAFCERGNVSLLRESFDEARMFYNKALKLDSGYAPAELGLAKTAKAQEEWAKAQEERARLEAKAREEQAKSPPPAAPPPSRGKKPKIKKSKKMFDISRPMTYFM